MFKHIFFYYIYLLNYLILYFNLDDFKNFQFQLQLFKNNVHMGI